MVRSKGISELKMKRETENKQTNKQTSNNKNKQITNRNRGGKQKTSRLIGNRRRKDDGNGSSVPPRKTHLKKNNKSTHNMSRCLSRSA